MAFLLPFLTGAAAIKTGIEAIAPHFFGGGYDAAPVSSFAPATTVDQPYRPFSAAAPMYDDPLASASMGLATTAAYSTRAITEADLPTGIGLAGRLPKTFIEWAKRVLALAGPAMLQAVINEYKQRRMSGEDSEDIIEYQRQRLNFGAKRRPSTRRRRINPTNVRALRRATRRIRSFKRVVKKVKGLGLWGRPRMVHAAGGYRRPRRRGDLWSVEELADERDEAGDLLDGEEGEMLFLEDGGDEEDED